MADLVGLALPFFGLILIGFLAGRIWPRDEDQLGWLNVFVIYFALPALFFRLISRTPVGEIVNWTFVFSTGLATYTAFTIAFLYAVIRNGGDLPEATVQGMVGGYGNVGYMGPPLALVAVGPQAAVPAALIFCVDVALVLTLGSLIIALAGQGREPVGKALLSIPRRVLLHPLFAATMVATGAAALRFEPPDILDRILAMLSASAAPCALFALGVTVAQQSLQRIPGELPVLIMVKLVAHPFIVFLILTWVGGFEPAWINTAVLMASLPPAATIYVLATQYQVYALRASSAILIGTAVSVLTVTVILFLITKGHLPPQPFGR